MLGRQSARIYTGHTAALIALLIWAVSRLRHAIHRWREPLSTAGDTGVGFRGVLGRLKGLGLTKVVMFGGTIRFVLEFPGWPSRPFGRMANRGGFNLADSGTGSSRHMYSAFLAITGSCPLHCRHCYERDNIGRDEEVPITRWKEVLLDVQEMGVAVVVLTGGEPMTRFDGLVEILASADKNLSEFHVHTSGHGVTPDRARKLRRAGLAAAGIGFDHWEKGRFDEIRGFHGAYDLARDAVRFFNEAGIFT